MCARAPFPPHRRYVVNNAMVDIFTEMSKVAAKMNSNTGEHAELARSPAYKPVREWMAERLDVGWVPKK